NWPEGGVRFGKGIWASPVLYGDNVLVASMDGEVAAIRVADASPAWAESFEADGAITELALIDTGGGEVLFVPSIDRHVYLLDPATGQQVGGFTAEDWIWTTPAFDPGSNVAYFGDFSGNVYALDITTSQLAWGPY